MADGDLSVFNNDRHAALAIREFQHFIQVGLIFKYIDKQCRWVGIQRTQCVRSGGLSINTEYVFHWILLCSKFNSIPLNSLSIFLLNSSATQHTQ